MAYKRTKKIIELIRKIDDAIQIVQNFRTEKEDALEKKSDKWIAGEAGQAEEENISALTELQEELESVLDKISNIFED